MAIVRFAVCILAALGLLLPARGEDLKRPKVPASLMAKEWEEVILTVHATGAETYICAMGPSRNYGWVLRVGEAELREPNGSVIGHYHEDGFGPTWKHADGSEVTGKTIRNHSPQRAERIAMVRAERGKTCGKRNTEPGYHHSKDQYGGRRGAGEPAL